MSAAQVYGNAPRQPQHQPRGLAEAFALLAELERLVPIQMQTVPPAHHRLTLEDGKLRVSVFTSRGWMNCQLTAQDLSRPGEEVAREVVGLLKL